MRLSGPCCDSSVMGEVGARTCVTSVQVRRACRSRIYGRNPDTERKFGYSLPSASPSVGSANFLPIILNTVL